MSDWAVDSSALRAKTAEDCRHNAEERIRLMVRSLDHAWGSLEDGGCQSPVSRFWLQEAIGHLAEARDRAEFARLVEPRQDQHHDRLRGSSYACAQAQIEVHRARARWRLAEYQLRLIERSQTDD